MRIRFFPLLGLGLSCGAIAAFPAVAQTADAQLSAGSTGDTSAEGSPAGRGADAPQRALSDPTTLSTVPPSQAGLLTSPRASTLGRSETSEAGRLTSAPVRLGGIGAPLDAVAAPEIEPGRSYSVVPSIGVQLLGTDNVFQTDRPRRADLVLSVSPGLSVAADTVRLQGSFSYLPVAEYYTRTSGQNRVDHRFDGAVLAALVPGQFYVDLRGFGGTQTATGGYTPEGNAVVNRRNSVQSTYVQVTPYVLQPVGRLATAQLGYSFTYSSQDGDSAFVPGSTQPFFTPQSFTSHEGFAVLRSNESLGRLVLEGRLDGTVYSGTGVLNGAYRSSATVEALYAVTRTVAVLVGGGYEDQRYGGVPPLRISGAVYSIGGRLTPSDTSTITAKYGHRDGFDAADLEASVRLGARVGLVASYTDRLSTSTRRNQDLLSVTPVDMFGYPAARGFAGPSLYGGSILAQQNSLVRLRHADATLTYSLPRDVFAFSTFYEEQTPVSAVPGTLAFSQRAYSGSLTWSHELTPRTTLVSFAQYGIFQSPAFGNGDVATGSVTLVRQLTDKLTGSIQYAISRRGSDVQSGRSLQNIVLIAARRTF